MNGKKFSGKSSPRLSVLDGVKWEPFQFDDLLKQAE
ncbi:hypothetical protein PARA125_000844 [Parachlamydia sp. AcF125]|nr:hypothetical protein [Parachlamydia sp. AcF125]